MKRSTLTAVAAVATIGAAGLDTSGVAEAGSIRATPDRAPTERRAAAQIGRAIAVKPKQVRRGAFAALPPFSNPAAISTRRLAGFPRHGKSFAILSSGDATDAAKKNTQPDHSTSLGGPSIRGSRDVTILRVQLRVPSGANCLSFRFRFLSDEFPEFVNDQYNDAFIAELDTSDWSTFSKEDPRVLAPGNFAAGPEQRLITVNEQGDTSVTEGQAKGTTYDGATPILRASTPVTPGRHLLYLSIFDQGDREYDSAVFVDKLVLGKRSSCQTGAVVD
jgi:hypothetical protein